MNLRLYLPILVFAVLTGQLHLLAQPERGKKAANQAQAKIAAGCLPATGYAMLDINNVRARINVGGDMWWDLQGNPIYEVPKGSGKNSMFSNSFWIGGVDDNNQLKLAAVRYRQVGNDFWPGPLTIDGTAYVDEEACSAYDHIFKITRAEVVEFLSHLDEETGQFIPTFDYPAPPLIIQKWPWQGDVAKGQSPYLAPFFDRNENGIYEWRLGDYPYYNFDLPCNSQITTKEAAAGITRNGFLMDQMLKGDQTLWWVFNDNGNIHSETGGEPMGIEVRAQAWALVAKDEINDVTFYNYEIINRSASRINQTYAAFFVNHALGWDMDDFIGCDVKRGLGFCYNGYDIDGTGQKWAYGANPPATGFDFIGGPYMDADGFDNPRGLCDESINGQNFLDGIPDNERMGMQVYIWPYKYGNIGQPQIASQYYLLMRGYFTDGTRMQYGGNAYPNMPGTFGPACNFMYPGDSDPCNWGTGGIPPNGPKFWAEDNTGNQPSIRWPVHSAGPFTLESGGVNYITTAVPWARATAGGRFASLELLRIVDDKCQRLFDNCFAILEGPDAPDLIIQELDKELILYWKNRKNNQNYNEDYAAYDPSIIFHDSIAPENRGDSLYRFQGYMIFQVADATVTGFDIEAGNADKVRLVAQCDIKDSIARIINYEFDGYLGLHVPLEKVNGANQGLFHSIRITEDKFASKDKKLINNKKYYFIAIAYAHNEFLPYKIDPALPEYLRGQKMPYIASRKTQSGGSIVAIPAIPHIPTPEKGGTVLKSEYGDGPSITRIEGNGNGGMVLELTKASIDKIMEGAPHKIENPTYVNGKGPINVKVIDPLNVKPGKFTLAFDPGLPVNSTRWTCYYENGSVTDTIWSQKTIAVGNEQLLLDYGLSITIGQMSFPGTLDNVEQNGFIQATMTYADSSKRWLTPLPDADINGYFNWIRSGTLDDNAIPVNNDYESGNGGKNWKDPEEYFEKILNGTWAPYRMVSKYLHGPQWSTYGNLNQIANLYSVNIVFTADKSKWTRCPVIETCDFTALAVGGADKMSLRRSPSKDREGLTGTPEATANGTQPTGMSYFPGYAINVETGERLNIAFGEDSWQTGDNGADMIWNPTSRAVTKLAEPYYFANYLDRIDSNQIIFGGKHFIYVFGHNLDDVDAVPAYDGGNMICNALMSWNQTKVRKVYADAMWVSIPMVAAEYAFTDPKNIPTDCTVRIRMIRPYKQYFAATTGAASPVNNNYPMYRFTTDDIATKTNVDTVVKTALDLINVVPNPYYAFSAYETDQLDNRIKITNLPGECTVSIYTTNGTLVRKFRKDDDLTYLEWDLKNYSGIPIAGGVYIIHVNAPGIGEKTIKWFGTLRPVDLNGF
jgi:hypothetical protein